MELTSFTAAHMVLRFPIMANAMLITQHSLLPQQCLHSIKAFFPATPIPLFLLPPPPIASRIRLGKRLGEDTAGTADLHWPRGCPTSYDIMLSNKRSGQSQTTTNSDQNRDKLGLKVLFLWISIFCIFNCKSWEFCLLNLQPQMPIFIIPNYLSLRLYEMTP